MLPLLYPILTGAFNPATWAAVGGAYGGWKFIDSSFPGGTISDDYLKAKREAGGPPARSSSNDLNMYHYMVQMRLKAIRENNQIDADAWEKQINELGAKLQLPGYEKKEFTPIFDPRSLGKTQESVESVEPEKENTSNYDPFYFMKPGYSSPVSANTDLPRTGSVESFGSISNPNTNKQTLQQAVSLLGLNNDYNLSLEASKAQQKRFWDNYKF